MDATWQALLVRGNEHMKWTLLAVCFLHASYPILATAFAVTMPVANGVQRALLWQTGRRNIVDLSRTRLVTVRVPPGTSPLALQQPRPTRLVFRRQQVLFSTSQTPPPPSSQGRRRSSSLGATVSGTETNAEGQTVETAATAADAAAAEAVAKQRASSRYIPSSYRGVRGGPKGKWKARIVSKGGLRQLGTFE